MLSASAFVTGVSTTTGDLIVIIKIDKCDNYVLQWWVEFAYELSWLFTNRFRATRCMKVKRMGITEILRRIWLFSANKMKSSESFSEQPTQLIVELDLSLQHIIVKYEATLSCTQPKKLLSKNFQAIQKIPSFYIYW